MSHTIAIVGPAFRVVGAQKEVTADVTQTSAYATGGEAVTAAELGLGKIDTADAKITTSVASATAVEVAPVVNTAGTQINLKFNTAAGESANAAVATNTVMRVTARGV